MKRLCLAFIAVTYMYSLIGGGNLPVGLRSLYHDSSQRRRLALNEPMTSPEGEKLLPTTLPAFGGQPISSRSFEEVRSTFTMASEQKIPLELVELPDDFTGNYKPATVDEFMALAHTIFSNTRKFGKLPRGKRKTDYAVVSICTGMDLCDLVIPNHIQYTSKHGYDYLLATNNADGVPPKALKYLLLAWALDRGYEWVLMLDADAVFTNVDITLPSLIAGLQPTNETSLIVTRGGDWKHFHPINNGVFLIDGTTATRSSRRGGRTRGSS